MVTRNEERVVQVQLYCSFNVCAPAALPLGNSPVTNCTGGWVDLGAGLDGAEGLALIGFDPRTVQPVASRYTGYDIPAALRRKCEERVLT